ncbi:ABC transporter ATP-binding protein, partial [Promicromonospora iranensis]|uniref:ABC transporter ATP-binding protein n=1 Tax=Promicromonospora iranensis TaxID=1105144 RepID=UPI0023AA0BC2
MDTTVYVPADQPAPAPGGAARAVRARNLSKTYGKGEAIVRALDGVDVDFEQGRFTAIMGPSGSGKSTLMHLLAGLDSATGGQAFLGDTEITGLNDKALTRLRRDRVGFVFQQFNLLPMFTAEQNITLPVELAGGTADRAWFDTLVETLGLAGR